METEKRYEKLNESALKAFGVLTTKVKELEVLVRTADLAARMKQHDVIVNQHDALVKRLGLLDDRLRNLEEKVEALTEAGGRAQPQDTIE